MDRNITKEELSPDIAVPHNNVRVCPVAKYPPQLPNKLVVLSSKRPFTFCTLDCDRPEDGFKASRRLPFKIGPHEDIEILTSMNGLVCVGVTKQEPHISYSDLILWNPTTGDHKTLSKPSSCYRDCYETDESGLCGSGIFGLYYRSCNDDYRLLRITYRRNIYIYSLKSDSWRQEDGLRFQSNRVPYFLRYWEPNVSLNGYIYFLEDAVGCTCSIVKFNTNTETLELIPTPPFGKQRSSFWNFLYLKDGCIHLWVNIDEEKNELWRMNEHGDWTMIADSGTILGGFRSHHRPIHLMKNGNFLMYNSFPGVFQVDIMKKLETKDLCYYTTKTYHAWPASKYIETSESPNQYMK